MQKNLFIKLFIFSLILEIICIVFYFTMQVKFVSQTLLYLVPFFFSTSFLANNYLIIKSSDKNPNKFIRAFLITTFLRLILYIIIIASYVLLFRYDAVAFLFTFFILFILYLIFDVLFLLHDIPKN